MFRGKSGVNEDNAEKKKKNNNNLSSEATTILRLKQLIQPGTE